MTTMADPKSGTAFDRPEISFAAPGSNTPAIHKLKAADPQEWLPKVDRAESPPQVSNWN